MPKDQTIAVKATLFSENKGLFTPELNYEKGKFASIEEAKSHFLEELRGFDFEEHGGFSQEDMEAGIKMRLSVDDPDSHAEFDKTVAIVDVPVPGMSPKL